MANPMDRRVRKTRRQLRQGLELLMQTKPVHDITIKELCDVCDINRGTFYLHYADVSALLQAIEQEMMDEFQQVLAEVTVTEKQKPKGKKPSPAMCGLVEFFAQNAAMCRILLCNNGDMAFVQQVKEVVRTQMISEWNVSKTQSAQSASGYAFAFVVAGCIGMLQLWLENDMPISPTEMAALLETIPSQGVIALAHSPET